VIDNLDDISVVDGYLPHNMGTGHTLITTRDPTAISIPAEGLEVTVLQPDKAVELLGLRSQLSGVVDTPEGFQEAAHIVSELGFLPLAIEQAAAFIREVSKDLFRFLNTYRENRKLIHERIPHGNWNYSASIATTWLLSFEAVTARNPYAAKLLQLLCFLDPDSISLDFLKEGSPENHLLAAIIRNDFLRDDALFLLEQFSLIRRNIENNKITIHRLVQSVIQDQMSVAEAYGTAGDIEQMIEGWTSLVGRHPEEWKLLSQLENAFASREKLEKMLASWPDSVVKCKALKLNYQTDEIWTWKALVGKHPTAWGIQVYLAKGFSKKGDIDQEVDVWRDLVDENPMEWKLMAELAHAYEKKAITQLELGIVDEEILGWKTLVSRHPEAWELQVRLQHAYSRKATMAQAVGIWERYVKAKRGDSIIKFSLWSKLKLMRYAQAETKGWETLVDLHPHSHGLQMRLDMAYNKRKYADVAIKGWKSLVEKYPERELALYLKQAYDKKGQLSLTGGGTAPASVDEEIAGWWDLVEKHPSEWTLQSHLSEAYSKKALGAAEAIAGWVELLNLHPKEQGLRDRLLYTCIQSGDMEMAMEQLKNLEHTDPKNAELPPMLKDMFLPMVEARRTFMSNGIQQKQRRYG